MSFSGKLICWYQKHKRSLPWRETNDAYTIWLSEIILQQTRVEQGLPYFLRFLERYPTVDLLAQASEQELLHLWQGLGYYSRARNMHKAAQIIVREYDGYFPKKYDKLLQLPGIGKYTAAAIASFSNNEPKAVVDGNVYRVLSRYMMIEEAINTPRGEKVFQALAEEFLDKESPALYNQAIMELGALICSPRNPNCIDCPFIADCRALAEKKQHDFPKKEKKASVKSRHLYYLVVQDENKNLVLKQREIGDIWANMYDFPLIETSVSKSISEIASDIDALFGQGNWIMEQRPKAIKHLLTHQRLNVEFISLKLKSFDIDKLHTHTFYALEEVDKLPKPKIIFEYINDLLSCIE